ncbi:MAG: hypothetical protein Kow00133_01470 [Amphiplicatus sp.]
MSTPIRTTSQRSLNVLAGSKTPAVQVGPDPPGGGGGGGGGSGVEPPEPPPSLQAASNSIERESKSEETPPLARNFFVTALPFDSLPNPTGRDLAFNAARQSRGVFRLAIARP